MQTLFFGSFSRTVFLVSCALFWTGCGKDEVTPVPDPQPAPVETGTVKLEFKNKVDTAALVFGKNYVNAKGDTFKVSKFNYYISNIRLVKSDNSVYSETNSYHMVKNSSPSSCIINLSGVPPGAYTSISFMLGVDSARNVSGAQSGDLDPAVASDMYWSWNSGYIFLKMEGTSPKSGEVSKNLEYHIGGYGGVNKTQRSFTFSFGSTAANVSTSATPVLELGVNLNELFVSPNLIDVSTRHTIVSAGPNAKLMADNYADMISLMKIRN
jgi:hypothetical protein